MNFPIIKNMEALGTTPLRRDALAILEAGYESVLTERVIRDAIEMKGNDICIRDKQVCLTNYERVFFVGIGKCAVDASKVFEELIGKHITDGIVLDVKSGIFNHLRSYAGTHPFPSEANVSVTKEVVQMLQGVTERDLVIVVVSGGGSSLLCLPHDVACETLQQITEAIWKKGGTISEVNTVRKHLSDIQGGQLAKFAYPATVLSFIFSDVPGNDMGIVASGPTVRDETTVDDAARILAKYDVINQCKLPNCELIETPKEEKYFEKVMNILLVTNEKALIAMLQKATELGYHAEIRNVALEGIAREVGVQLATQSMPARSCFLYGGETTVLLKDAQGSGGRGQECALAAMEVIPKQRVFIAASSDGWDNTPVAGAITDADDRERARALLLNSTRSLEWNDSYTFWQAMGGALDTGRTGINVSDFYIVLSG